ncbi:MAG: Uma2 family endonuclease [Hyphomicrobiaceae bacterium]|nr:Uma2 family endonuclease [Hyphomicrobiaceae bacterium]
MERSQMSAHVNPLRRMTAEEFIAWGGDGHPGKLELVNGVVRAMSPASGTHALIQSSIAGLLRGHLKARNSPCRVGTEAPIRPRMRSDVNVRAPDVAVTCVPKSRDEKFFPDPILIVEVLSPSNERETWESIWACATIPTIQEVMVVDSERIRVVVYTKDSSGAWPEEPRLAEAGGTVRLASIDAAIAIAEIYADTNLV